MVEHLSKIIGRNRPNRHLNIVDSTLSALEGVDATPSVLEGVEATPSALGTHRDRPIMPPEKNSSSCQKCRGFGYFRPDVPFGHPEFNKLVPCACKKAEKKERDQRHLEEMAQIHTLHRFADADFNSFDVTRPGVKDAYRAAMRFASRPKGWLVLKGPYGCGKTHLAASVAKERLDEGESVLFQTVPELLDYLRAAFNPYAEETYDQLFTRLREAEVLVLDDLGAHQATGWATEKLFQLLNYRYNTMAPTMITLNRLETVDPRLISRLGDAGLVTYIAMDSATDYRPLMKPPVTDL